MKIKAAIIGTGNIGTDLLLKSLKTDFIDLVAFVGRRLDSDTMKIAKFKKVTISDQGINYFINNPKCCDVVYDCTNADDAREHAKVFKEQGIKVIDLTPAKVGDMCVPDINADLILTDNTIMLLVLEDNKTYNSICILSEHMIKNYNTVPTIMLLLGGAVPGRKYAYIRVGIRRGFKDSIFGGIQQLYHDIFTTLD
jgi:acetaldehyde dehydrogenase (acetylating)